MPSDLRALRQLAAQWQEVSASCGEAEEAMAPGSLRREAMRERKLALADCAAGLTAVLDKLEEETDGI